MGIKMKKRKKIWSLVLCVIMLFGITACSKEVKKDVAIDVVTNEQTEAIGNETISNEDISNEQTEEVTQTPAEVEVGIPTNVEAQNKIVLTDQAGREVTLEHKAEKIVSCYYITTYASIALGLEDRLVGIESKAGSREIYQMAAPELLELPSVGTLKEFNIEATAALKPDLVIMPKKLLDYADALTELGIPVLVVYPESQDLLEEMLNLIGTACGVEEDADALLSYYEETLNQIGAITASLNKEQKKTVYMAGNSSYLSTATNAMYQGNLIELAGGSNAAASIEGDYWMEVSYEDILAMNPEVMIIPSSAEYTVDDILGDVQLSEVTAVKEGAIYKMPAGIEEWDSPIPSGVQGVRWLCSVLNSDLYEFDQMKSDVVSFYQTFYGFDLDAELITK